jgi:hypothetical protein
VNAAALALWLAVAQAAAAPDAGRPRDAGAEAKRADDPDEDLIRHLDEIERAELLDNLELFDSAPDAEKEKKD